MDSPKSIRVINFFEEEDHLERYNCSFRFIDLTIDDLYNMTITTIEE